MKRSKSAFTMIELVFVILILGILAVVSIPKLRATRADAKASTLATSIVIGATEIASYAVARGQTESDFSLMSNSIKLLVDSGEAQLGDKNATISTGTIVDCVVVSIVRNATDDILTISFGNPQSDSDCTLLQSLINTEEYPIKLRGASIVY